MAWRNIYEVGQDGKKNQKKKRGISVKRINLKKIKCTLKRYLSTLGLYLSPKSKHYIAISCRNVDSRNSQSYSTALWPCSLLSKERKNSSSVCSAGFFLASFSYHFFLFSNIDLPRKKIRKETKHDSILLQTEVKTLQKERFELLWLKKDAPGGRKPLDCLLSNRKWLQCDRKNEVTSSTGIFVVPTKENQQLEEKHVETHSPIPTCLDYKKKEPTTMTKVSTSKTQKNNHNEQTNITHNGKRKNTPRLIK